MPRECRCRRRLPGRALGLDYDFPTPMNSGWSKVAALATAYLEGSPDEAPHVIWNHSLGNDEPVLDLDVALFFVHRARPQVDIRQPGEPLDACEPGC